MSEVAAQIKNGITAKTFKEYRSDMKSNPSNEEGMD